MSSRHLRRVLASREIIVEVDSDEEYQPKAKASAFGLLLDAEDELEDEDETDVAETEDEKAFRKVPEPDVKAPTTTGKVAKQAGTSSLEEDASSDEEFEAALEKLALAKAQDSEAKDSSWPLFELLEPDSELLNPLAELKRKLGNFNTAAGPADQRFSGLIDRVTAKSKRGPTRKGRSQLVVPQPTWPAVPMAAIGLELRPDGVGFVLEHSRQYLNDLATAVFMMRQGDIDGLVSFVRTGHPYQVDALLVISDFVRMSSSGEASELVEWAIHLMERCFTGSGFNPFSMVGRGSLLPYEVPENRKMHLALFRNVQYLLKRGCYRTALEFSKLMLCLDINDALMVTPLMAYAALQAKQYDWIIAFNKELLLWRPHHFDWSLTAALAHLMKDEKEEASAMLVNTLSENPFAVPACAQAVGLEWPDDHRADASVHGKALAKIYTLLLSPVWKEGKVSAWLEQALPALHHTRTEDADDSWENPFEHARIYRHCLLSDIQNLNVPLPRSIAARELNIYDPIPPEQLGVSTSLVSSLADSLSKIIGRFF